MSLRAPAASSATPPLARSGTSTPTRQVSSMLQPEGMGHSLSNVRAAIKAKSKSHVDLPPPGALHVAAYLKPTKARLVSLQCTSVTLDELLARLPSVKNDPRFPSFTDHVGERARHAAIVARQLGRSTSDFPPLVFPPGGVMDSLEDLIEGLEADLVRTKSDAMKSRDVAVCEHFIRGECPRGVTCPFSHVQESLRAWAEKWLRRVVFSSSVGTGPTTVASGPAAKTATLTSAAFPLGQEAWAVVVEAIRGPKWTESGRPPVTRIVARHVTKRGMAVLTPAIANNWIPSLTALDLSKNNLAITNPKAVMRLADALPSNSSLLELNLSHNGLGLGGALLILRALTPVDDVENAMTESSITGSQSKLNALNLASNDVLSSDPAFPHLCIAVAATLPRLQKLSLADNSLGPDATRRLLRAITEKFPLFVPASVPPSPKVPSPKNFSPATMAGSPAASLKAPRLQVASAPTCRFLNLASNRLGESGFVSVAEFISSSSVGRYLLHLDLSWNRGTIDGLTALCTALAATASGSPSASPTGASMGASGPATKAGATPATPPDVALKVPGGVPSVSGVFAASVKNTESIDLPAAAASMIGGPEFTADHAQLQSLRLGYNPGIGRKGGIALSQMLQTNTSLTSIDMRWTSIGDEGAASFYEMLNYNKTVLEMPLTGNDIEPRNEESIRTRLRKRMEHGLPPGVVQSGACGW